MQNLTELRIIAITVDHKRVTLYDEQGETYTLNQGDVRIPSIIENALPLVEKHQVAIVSLVPPKERHYQDIEENSSGLVKMFRVAKNKIKALFGHDNDPETQVTIRRGGSAPILTPEQAEKPNPVEEVMKHAIPVSSPDFHQRHHVASSYDVAKSASEETTICAMVDGVIIPGVENLERYLQRASTLGSYDGIINFLKRIAAVINERSHSIEDLLLFLERADLPIADDGSIVIYKILRRKKDASGYYVDCHTGQVTQRVGSYVHMAHELVDHDRRKECSNGLHVARRSYINNFPGDVCTVAKLAPEDVIAVPTYDANKMRVCGYHILEELSSEMYQQLKLNKPMTDIEAGKRMLGRILAGDHIGKIERVTIRGHHGSNVLIEPMEKGDTSKKDIPTEDHNYSAEALPDEGEEAKAPPVDFNTLNKKKEQPKEENMELTYDAWMRKLAIANTRKQRIDALLGAFNAPDASNIGKQIAAAELRKEKIEARKGYGKLGIPLSEIEPYLVNPESKAPAAVAVAGRAKKKTVKAVKVTKKASPNKGKKVAYSSMTNKEKAADLWLDFQTAPDAPTRKQAATALMNFKQEKKVTWEKLGLDSKEMMKKIKHLLD